MPNAVAIAAAGLLFLVGLRLAWVARDQSRVLTTLRNLSATSLAEAAPGLRRVRGRLESDTPTPSPFQGRPSVYSFFRVLEPKPQGKPRLLATGKSWSPARVADATGTAELEPWTARVTSPRRHEATFRGLAKIPPELAAFFEKAGIDERHLRRLPLFVVHEYTLEPGDEVHVLGTLDAGAKRFHRARRRPYVVSSDPELGIERGLRVERVLFSILAPILLLAALGALALGLLA